MVDTVNSLASRVHELLVGILTHGPTTRDTSGLHDVIARSTSLGSDGAWLGAAGHAVLGVLACVQGQEEQAVHHLDAAVTAGYNDCLTLHSPPMRPLHRDPRFRALYARMRITQADLDEVHWLHQEMHILAGEVQQASVDNIGRLDTGVSPLPLAPMPTREPHTRGVLITRIDLAATQTALHQAVMKAEFERSAGNTSLSLIDDTWDHPQARRDAWHADELDDRRLRAAEARAFVERRGAGALLLPCPPLGSIVYPG
ncbi:hypothetical protein ABTY59_24390 [Streptomyces sp. NPDC096079]|uniref:hypothetical protein n=1 Tax=unclassified Streptomyces TaxID=2593676 RepID=UPI003322EDB3